MLVIYLDYVHVQNFLCEVSVVKICSFDIYVNGCLQYPPSLCLACRFEGFGQMGMSGLGYSHYSLTTPREAKSL